MIFVGSVLAFLSTITTHETFILEIKVQTISKQNGHSSVIPITSSKPSMIAKAFPLYEIQ